MKQMAVHWNYSALTCRGKAHAENEDRVLLDGRILESGSVAGTGEGRLLAAICDGIGGETGGARAAEIAVEYFRTMEKDITSIYAISEAAMEVNKFICHAQRTNSDSPNMSTTIAGLFILDSRFLAFNIGDTRIYMNDRDGCRQISRDHTAERRSGTGKAASRMIVTHYLGGRQDVWFPALHRGTLHQPTAFILCSDGIYRKVNHGELSELVGSRLTAEEKCQAIANRAVYNGSTDDISVVLVETDG